MNFDIKHPLPLGTEIYSHEGEWDTGDWNEAKNDYDENRTGPRAIGKVVMVNDYDCGWSYGVEFLNGTLVHIDENELKGGNYLVGNPTIDIVGALRALTYIIAYDHGVVDDGNNGHRNPQPPNGDDYNEIYQLAVLALKCLTHFKEE